MSTYCRACREYRVHWMNTKILPVIPRHTLVPYICEQDFIVRHNTLPKPPNALLLSLYWEGDLRNLSYFWNKRKEMEFYI